MKIHFNYTTPELITLNVTAIAEFSEDFGYTIYLDEVFLNNQDINIEPMICDTTRDKILEKADKEHDEIIKCKGE